MEAWAAAVLLPMAAAVIWRTRRENHVPISGLLVLGVSALPLAQQLFAVLRGFDDAHVKLIWVETPPSGMAWDGVRDRLQRASA